MTSTEPNEHQSVPSTVVESLDYDNGVAVIHNYSKTKLKFIVYKPRYEYQFFRIKPEKGPMPDALQGHYSSLDYAVSHVVKYLDNLKESQAVKNDRLDQDRKERHAAKSDSSNSK